jgi:hypothetical protein
MKRVLFLGLLLIGEICSSVQARGFGGAAAAPVGEGIGGTGALWTDSIMGSGGLWADGAYGGGLPWYEGVPGGNAAYGGFFSGPPRLDMKYRETYNPLAGERQAIGGAQMNANAQRQNFVRSLAGMGIGTGGFQPGEFGPPPRAGGLPTDMGMHQAGGTGAYGYARGGGRLPASGDGARAWTAADLRVFGNAVRAEFRDYSVFNRDWYARYPRAWRARESARDVWTGATWADVNAWFGGELPNYQYTYGSDLVYDGNTVYLCGRPIAAADKYYQSAVSIATGEQTKIEDGAPVTQWLPLGVFEAIRSGKKTSTMLFQLAVNKAGTLRGNYFDTADRNVQLVEGSVDKETQRVAWMVADKTSVVFDCVLYNLTRAETPVLVHMGPDKNEQWVFVRLAREEMGR